jgi:hypothetical protein
VEIEALCRLLLGDNPAEAAALMVLASMTSRAACVVSSAAHSPVTEIGGLFQPSHEGDYDHRRNSTLFLSHISMKLCIMFHISQGSYHAFLN